MTKSHWAAVLQYLREEMNTAQTRRALYTDPALDRELVVVIRTLHRVREKMVRIRRARQPKAVGFASTAARLRSYR